MFENAYIKLKGDLNQADYEEIVNLKNKCYEYEKIQLKLELEFKMKNSAFKNSGEINEFMFYDNITLVGYLGICDFGGNALEINGMVHPQYRRKGIFKKLFSLVKDEWLKRDSNQMLVLSDRRSEAGIEFIKKISSSYDHSEYEMYLNNYTIQEYKLNNIHLIKADKNDAEEIAKHDSIYFGTHINEEDILIKSDPNTDSITYFAGFNNIIIGKVRTEINNGIGGIYGLGVLPEHRNKGYGRKILSLAIEKLKEKNVVDIILQVDVDNINALNLYKSCGFEEYCVMDYYKLNK